MARYAQDSAKQRTAAHRTLSRYPDVFESVSKKCSPLTSYSAYVRCEIEFLRRYAASLTKGGPALAKEAQDMKDALGALITAANELEDLAVTRKRCKSCLASPDACLRRRPPISREYDRPATVEEMNQYGAGLSLRTREGRPTGGTTDPELQQPHVDLCPLRHGCLIIQRADHRPPEGFTIDPEEREGGCGSERFWVAASQPKRELRVESTRAAGRPFQTFQIEKRTLQRGGTDNPPQKLAPTRSTDAR